mmetsp:Transcript_98418/g.195167  ORF Transcript_98418/g.195167 Transcript_98418/m.195167 type:complete len:584 (+) Transcript_98418:92-1843(+)
MLPFLGRGSNTEALLGSCRSAAASRLAAAAWRQQHRGQAPYAAASRAFIPPPPPLPPPPARSDERASPSSASALLAAVLAANSHLPVGESIARSNPVLSSVPPLAQPINGHDGHTTGATQLPPPPPPPLPFQVPGPGHNEGGALQPPPNDAADKLLRTLAVEGMRAGLVRHWSQLEALQSDQRFTCDQIAWIFHECSKLPFLEERGHRHRGSIIASPQQDVVSEVPLANRIVQLFSNFVCERVPELTPQQITIFVVALTSSALPMDEFWLFMMAKRIQDTTRNFNPEQVTTIAQRYSYKALEDDEFFEAMSLHVLEGLADFTLPQLATFMVACARIRFLHEDLCKSVLPLFQTTQAATRLGGEALGAALTAAALLDRRSFQPLACCWELANSPTKLKCATASTDLSLGIALAAVYLRHGAGVRLLLPRLLQHITLVFTRSKGLGRRSRQELGMARRRVMLVGLCAALGVPRRNAWGVPLLRLVQSTFSGLSERVEEWGHRDIWEPSPSSFHLEVVAVLRLLQVDHRLETPQQPFSLDITISAAQQVAAQEAWATREAVLQEWDSKEELRSDEWYSQPSVDTDR